MDFNRNKLWIIALSLLAIAPCSIAINDAAVKTEWGYRGVLGPKHWGSLNPEFKLCSEGQRQSPINVTAPFKAEASPLEMDYQPAQMEIVEDGVTRVEIGETPLLIKEGHGLQLNFSQERESETIKIDGDVYRLIQLHLHTPSENQLNNKNFPLEVHLVHQGSRGKLAVIGVLVEPGKANPLLQKMLDHFPKEKGAIHVLRREKTNPMDLIPQSQEYFGFDGSLTTPPCTENVRWLVMKHPITASTAQIRALQARTKPNARPIQARNAREIRSTPRKN